MQRSRGPHIGNAWQHLVSPSLSDAVTGGRALQFSIGAPLRAGDASAPVRRLKMKHRFKINCNGVLFLLRGLMAGETPALEGTNGQSHRRGRRRLHARAGEDPLESAVADRAVSASLLHRRLSRQGERRHRQPDDERRPRSLAIRIRLECRAVLLRLFPGGGAEQSGLAGDRRP